MRIHPPQQRHNAMTTEEKVSQTILDEQLKVTIGGKDYYVASPTIGTLIKISSLISTLPKVSMSADNLVSEVLSNAKDCAVIGDILAVLILGAKDAEKTETVTIEREERSFFGLMRTTKTEEVKVSRRERLSREIVDNCSPRELHNTFVRLLSQMELSDFFGVTPFLIEANIMKQTKVVSRTASGA